MVRSFGVAGMGTGRREEGRGGRLIAANTGSASRHGAWRLLPREERAEALLVPFSYLSQRTPFSIVPHIIITTLVRR